MMWKTQNLSFVQKRTSLKKWQGFVSDEKLNWFLVSPFILEIVLITSNYDT